MYNENQNSSGEDQRTFVAKTAHGLSASDDTNSFVEAAMRLPTGHKAPTSASEPHSMELGQTRRVNKIDERLPTSIETLSSGEDRGNNVDETVAGLSSPDDSTINQIRYWHRQRKFGMEQRKRADLALGAFLRTMLGWRKDLPKDESDRIKAAATALMKKPEGEWASVIEAAQESRKPFETIEDKAKKNMEKLAKSIPLWKEFGEPIKGFGAVTFAIILAEAGDLSKYPTKSHLWKRLGLAVIDGKRQGNPGTGAKAEDWIAHGYNPSRRSQMFVMGDSMLKKQIGKVKDANGEDTGERQALGYYGDVYLARKQYELMRDPEMKPIQAHRRAQRYMEKRLLKNLWQAWRRDRDVEAERPSQNCPDVRFLQAAE